MTKTMTNEEAKALVAEMKALLEKANGAAMDVAKGASEAQLRERAKMMASMPGSAPKGDRILSMLGQRRCDAREDLVRAAAEAMRDSFTYLVQVACGDEPTPIMLESVARHLHEKVEAMRAIETTIRDVERA